MSIGTRIFLRRSRIGSLSPLLNSSIFCWNVRGPNEKDKRLRIRGLVRDWKANIVCLLEIKLENISREVVQSCWGCQHVDWLFMGSRGALRGILLMRDTQVVEKIEDCVGSFTVACSFRIVEDNFVRAFAGVYDPNDDGVRRYLRDELVGLMSWWELPWCIRDDFNVVRFSSEKSSDSRHSSTMVDFSDFIF
jgi:hypothetical protein